TSTRRWNWPSGTRPTGSPWPSTPSTASPACASPRPAFATSSSTSGSPASNTRTGTASTGPTSRPGSGPIDKERLAAVAGSRQRLPARTKRSCATYRSTARTMPTSTVSTSPKSISGPGDKAILVVAILVILGWAATAHAEDPVAPVVPSPAPAGTRTVAETPFHLVLPQGHLLGDWAGARPWLEERGITPTLTFVMDA